MVYTNFQLYCCCHRNYVQCSSGMHIRSGTMIKGEAVIRCLWRSLVLVLCYQGPGLKQDQGHISKEALKCHWAQGFLPFVPHFGSPSIKEVACGHDEGEESVTCFVRWEAINLASLASLALLRETTMSAYASLTSWGVSCMLRLQWVV
jgi:hypothetical protein